MAEHTFFAKHGDTLKVAMNNYGGPRGYKSEITWRGKTYLTGVSSQFSPNVIVTDGVVNTWEVHGSDTIDSNAKWINTCATNACF